MYSCGLQLVFEPVGTGWKAYGRAPEPEVWRKWEKWKAGGMRWPKNRHRRPVQGFMEGKGTMRISKGRGQIVSVLGKAKVQVRSRFATTVASSVVPATEAAPPQVTDIASDKDETLPVHVTGSESFTERLPLQVSVGLTLESLGKPYKGPNEDKYWSEIRCGLQHPYPVGYTAIKTYKGIQFKQTIEEGLDGPIFVVGEVHKPAYSAESPAKAWSLALENSRLNSTTRIHGRKHFGFDYPIVLQFLSQMHVEVFKRGNDRTDIFNRPAEEAGISGRVDLDQQPHLEASDVSVHVGEMASNEQEDRLSPNVRKYWSSSKESSLPPRNRLNLGASGRSIRLRSVLMNDANQQVIHILPCRENSHPGTRGFLEEVMANGHNRDSISTGTPPSKELSLARRRILDQNGSSVGDGSLKKGASPSGTALNSILKRMDEGARVDARVGVSDNSPWSREGLELATKGGTAEQEVMRKKSSMSRLFSSSGQRSRFFPEDPAMKNIRRPGQTRSLANVLEEWNKSGKRQPGKRSTQLSLHPPPEVYKMPLIETVSQVGRLDSTVENTEKDLRNDSAAEDIENKIRNWSSGSEGQSSVLKEIGELVLNNSVDQALQILRRLHSTGTSLGDVITTVFFSFEFDNWQREAVEQMRKNSVLLCTPGGAGKSTVAARCMYEALVQGERSLFVTSSESSAEEHRLHFQKLFGKRNVGSLLLEAEDESSQFPITVVTLQALVKELRESRVREPSEEKSVFLEGITFAVMDRFHTLGDAECGSLWEEAVVLLDRKVKLAALSLPIEAAHDVAAWIRSIHSPCEVVICESEPVPKSHYVCDRSGLHFPGTTKQEALPISSPVYELQNTSDVEANSMTHLQQSIRVLLREVDAEKFFPIALSFSSVEDCFVLIKEAKELIPEDLLIKDEAIRLEQRVADFFDQNADIHRLVNKDDLTALSGGYSVYHDGLLPVWREFVQGLVRDNLVKIVFGTDAMLCRSEISFRTVAVYAGPAKAQPGNVSRSNSDLKQLLAKAGRRGLDSSGNVISFGSNGVGQNDGILMGLDSSLRVHSHFKPSYSLLLSLLSRHALTEVRQLMESNYGDYLVKKQLNKELKELGKELVDAKERKRGLEATFFHKLNKINTAKLQDATIFTHVDVRVTASESPWVDRILPGILCAVLPGPAELLYVILCDDNNFRLLPAGALDHVYTEEERLDSVYQRATGHTLRAFPLPVKGKWKKSPGDSLEYTSEGTAKTAPVVEVLVKYGVKSRRAEEERNCRTEITSCNGLLSTLSTRQESMQSSDQTPASAIWTKSEKLMQVLEKANAMELMSADDTHATLKPLGVLISKLHFVENELWYANVLSSSIVKPLTAPELGAICSALIFSDWQGDCKSVSSNEANIAPDAPKRLRAALEKLENLREKVQLLQDSDEPPVRLDGRAVAVIHSLHRGTGQDPVDKLECGMMLFVQRIIKLLQVVDNVWGQSTHVLSALDGATGLHNVARRAVHILQKAIASGR